MKLLNEFVIKGSPSTVTAQQKGLRIVRGHPQFFEKKHISEAKADLADKMLTYVPDDPYNCKIYLRVLWLFDKKSLTKKEWRTFNDHRPDLDNLCKGLLDVMVGVGFFDDDSTIIKLDLTKAWSREYPGLFIQIIQIDDDEEQSYQQLIDYWRHYGND